MQATPLTTNMIFRRAETYWGTRRVATRTVSGIGRTTVAEIATEARRIAGALDALGLAADSRVGSFAWNTARHLALYFGVPCTGRVLHTLNIRYFADQLVYTVEHAEDEVIFVDRSLLPLLAGCLPRLRTVRHVVVMTTGRRTSCPTTRASSLGVSAWSARWTSADRVTDENTASAMCYTTGTTGNPKGVLYSHRSTYLHSLRIQTRRRSRSGTESDNVMPVVPMFHAMAWGLPYASDDRPAPAW